MDESRRKRKSLWDAEEESKNSSWTRKERYSTDDGWHHQNRSPSPAANNSLKPKDQSAWLSWEPHHAAEKLENSYRDGRDVSQISRDNSRYKSMSPGFDGWGQRKRNHSPEDSLGQSHRYVERGRSRSRDRGRSRGRSRSRSRSWSRGRGRDRGGGWHRSRSRSRSRSPFHDRRNESYGWNDRRSGSGVSSQTCRDFSVGKCRRGSQCRFLHPDNINQMDRDCPEKELAERSGSRIERGQDTRYSNSEGPGAQSWGRFSDVTYGEDEPLGNRSRGRIPCKDFMRGKCKWGASCRFSHHSSSGDNGDQGGRNASFGRDHEHRTSETGKTVCKYFLAGNCHRVNCRFSHDGPTSNNHESRPHDEGEGRSLVDKNGRWDGRTWDEIGKVSNITKATGWSESVGASRTNTDTIPIDMIDNTWGHESRTWGNVQSKEKASGNVEYLSPHKWNEDNSGDRGPIKSMITENFNEGREHLTSKALESPNMDGISMYARGQNIGQETSGQHFAMTAMHAEVFRKSDIQQHQNVVDDNIAKTFSFGGLDGAKNSTNTINPVVMPGQSLYQNGAGNLFKHSLVENDQRDNMLPNQLSAQNVDLNGPGQLLYSALNSQSQIQSHHKEAAKTPEMQEHVAPQSFPNFTPSGQDAQIAYHTRSLSQKFVNEQEQPRPHTALNPQTSIHLMSSLQSLVPSFNMTYVQPNSAVRPDHSNPLGDGTELGNSNQPPGNLPHSFEQKNQLLMEQFSPLSTGNAEFEETLQGGNHEVQHHESPKSKQQETTAVSKIEGININDATECKDKQENIHKKGVNDNGKVEDAAGIKDDKEMRLFKNALIEFVKEILKPTWKEGRMSREVHKTVVKKVVDKVTSTIQADHVPKTQDRIEQFLSHSKSKITKLVQAYVERNLKTDS